MDTPQNKEIYDFFRNRQHLFDEMPGQELWQKIEAGLPATPKLWQKWRTPVIMAFLLIVIGIIGTLVIITTNEEDRKVVEPSETVAPQTKGVKPDEIKETETPVKGDTVRKKKFRPKPETSVIDPTPVNYAVNPLPVLTDTIVISAGTTNRTGKASRGRLTVVSDEKLTPAEFDELVVKTLSNPEIAVGTIVIVRAPGHKPFRQVFKGVGESPIMRFSTRKLKSKNVSIKSAAKPAYARITVSDTVIIKPDTITIQPDHIFIPPRP